MIAYIATLALAAVAEPGRTDLPKEESREVMRNFARCMAKHHETDSRRIVETSPGDPAAWEFHKLMRPSCMPRTRVALSLYGKVTHYRYSLAEALVLRDNRNGPPSSPAELPPLEHPAIPPDAPMPAGWPGDSAKWELAVAASQGNAYLSAFGECVVRTAPDLSWALLQTDVATKHEDAAFANLGAAMSSCVAKDQKVELNKFNVRGSIALNTYRLAKASSGAGTAAGVTK